MVGILARQDPWNIGKGGLLVRENQDNPHQRGTGLYSLHSGVKATILYGLFIPHEAD